MSRILLVDDEPLTTRTLQTLILDAMPEVEVYSVNSATQAMELLNRNVYDVVVTDVSMPRVSGLELLDQVKKLWPMSYVIVLTAYSSFDYAYKASQYEDVRFILKVEPPDVIMDAIRTGLSKVRQYFSASEDDQRIREYIKDTMPLLRQTLLERLLLFREELPDSAVCENCGISILPGQDTWLAVTGPMERQEKKQEICYLVLSILRDRGFRTDAYYAETNLVFLIQEDSGADISTLIQGQLDRVIEGADPAVGLSFAVSSVPVPWARIGEASAALINLSRNDLARNQIIQKNPLMVQECSLTLSDALRWRREIERRDLEGLLEAVRSSALAEGYPQGRKDCAMLLQLQLRECFGSSVLERVKVEGYTAESVLFHSSFDSLDGWLDAVRLLLEALFSGRSARQTTETEEMLDRINRYVQEHLTEQISLTQIAEQFNYNSSYLSRIYKQYMHEGLNEHIVRTKIEAARSLLKGSGMSVGDIAEKCGFQTTKYFITVFKRIVGKTPKAWRETDGQVK